MEKKLDTNSELLLTPSKPRQLRLFITSLVFVAGGIWMIGRHEASGWFVSLFFALCALIFVIKILPGASYLRLTKEGFELRTLFKSHFYRWTDVQNFQVGAQYRYGVPIRTCVAFDFTESYSEAGKTRALARAISNTDMQISDTYGLEAKKLAELMTEWKANAL